ncbi:hypothetical protein JCM15519_20950 [Fundidesulfovibrio butyratiphilus]
MALPVYVHGAATVKSRMRSLPIEEAEPGSKRLAGLAADFEFPQGDALPDRPPMRTEAISAHHIGSGRLIARQRSKHG